MKHTSILANRSAILSPLVESSHPADQVALPVKYYERRSSSGYLHTLSTLAAFFALLWGVGAIELDGQLACVLALALVADRTTQSMSSEEAVDLPRGHFQLITLFSALEHLAGPRAALRRCHEYLAPGWSTRVRGALCELLERQAVRNRYWGGYHTPHHWNLFSIDTVRNVCQPMGYRVHRLYLTTEKPTTCSCS